MKIVGSRKEMQEKAVLGGRKCAKIRFLFYWRGKNPPDCSPMSSPRKRGSPLVLHHPHERGVPRNAPTTFSRTPKSLHGNPGLRHKLRGRSSRKCRVPQAHHFALALRQFRERRLRPRPDRVPHPKRASGT